MKIDKEYVIIEREFWYFLRTKTWYSFLRYKLKHKIRLWIWINWSVILSNWKEYYFYSPKIFKNIWWIKTQNFICKYINILLINPILNIII